MSQRQPKRRYQVRYQYKKNKHAEATESQYYSCNNTSAEEPVKKDKKWSKCHITFNLLLQSYGGHIVVI